MKAELISQDNIQVPKSLINAAFEPADNARSMILREDGEVQSCPDLNWRPDYVGAKAWLRHVEVKQQYYWAFFTSTWRKKEVKLKYACQHRQSHYQNKEVRISTVYMASILLS